VVREAVQAAVREVLGNPALLKAAAQAQEPAAGEKPEHKPAHQAAAEVHGEVRAKAGAVLAEVWKVLSAIGTYCLTVALCGGDHLFGAIRAVGGQCVRACSHLSVWAGRLWRFRRTCATAASVGLCCGVLGYVAGPVLAAGMCAIGGAAL